MVSIIYTTMVYNIPVYNPFEILDFSEGFQKRTDAFISLSDKKIMNKILIKTKMCRFGNRCPRKVCTFAHSCKELQPSKCVFGETCRFMNHPTRTCTFLHPNETIKEFIERTGLQVPGKVDNIPKELEI